MRKKVRWHTGWGAFTLLGTLITAALATFALRQRRAAEELGPCPEIETSITCAAHETTAQFITTTATTATVITAIFALATIAMALRARHGNYKARHHPRTPEARLLPETERHAHAPA